VSERSLELVRRLSSPGFWPGVAEAPLLIETHVSWVVLAGDRAYKIKKPVRYSFVDFSTLEARAAACEEELRLNRRLAPELYLRVMPIGGSPGAPVPDATPAIEYAVVMRRFPQSARLDHKLAAGTLTADHMLEAADMLAAFHATLEPAPPASPWGTPAAVTEPFAETLEDLGDDVFARWSERLDEVHERLTPSFEARKAAGSIRECHGDLHLANLVELDGRIRAFDCLEFDPALRWIDVINEATFPFMDLAARDAEAFAWPFLDRYLAQTGDYGGLELVRYYTAYHAFVRAKIAKLSGDDENRARYLRIGERNLVPRTGTLVLMHGFSGSGKTTVSDGLIACLPAVRIRSDVERKRLANLAPEAATGSPVGGGLYAPAETRRTYEHLRSLAVRGVRAGVDVIVDAAFLEAWQRALFAEAERSEGFPLLLVDCRAPRRVLEERVRQRSAAPDVSEADLAVLAHQLAHAEPPGDDEGFVRVAIDTSAPVDASALAGRLRSAASGAPASILQTQDAEELD